MTRFTFRPVLTVCAIVGLVILYSLGSWQWAKVGPKTALIEDIRAGLSEEPVDLADLVAQLPYAQIHYRRVKTKGQFLEGKPLRLTGMDKKARSGYHLYGFFETEAGQIILTSIGWVPFDLDELPSFPSGRVEISGVLIQPGYAGSMTPENSPTTNTWYWADAAAMASVFGLGDVAPIRLILDDTQNGYPEGGQVRMDIPNDHFQYALTWWGLALTLISVYVAFSIGRKEEQ